MALRGIDPDLAPVGSYDLLDNRQTQSQATVLKAVVLAAKVWREQVGQVLRMDSGAVVLYLEDDEFALGERPDDHRPLLRAKLEGVGGEVHESLLEPFAVGLNDRQILSQFELQRLAPAVGLGPKQLYHTPDNRRYVNGLGLDLVLPGFIRCLVDQAIDPRLERARAGQQVLDQAALSTPGVGPEQLLQHLARAQDRGQGGPELMGKHTQKAPPIGILIFK